MPITHKELIEILERLEGSACEEFSLQMDGIDLALRRNVAGPSGQAQAPRTPLRKAAKPAVRENEQPAPQQREESARGNAAPGRPGAQASGDAQAVSAPMAGTFYRRPGPDEAVFVEMGAQISKGDPLCLIEVMKLFSTVYAEFAGRVVGIEVEDGDSVKQGQTLILIEAD